jgi:serine/threonine protein kinase
VVGSSDTSPQGFPQSDRFELIWRLGSGGMGVVYEALDRHTNQRVALKTMRTMSPRALMRFKAEFRALRDLRHPNLVQLGELFEESGRWFFTMELVDGCDFLAYVRDGGRAMATVTRTSPETDAPESAPAERSRTRLTLDENSLKEATAQLVRGLLELHRTGKVHRDIKPPNVRVSREGRVVLLDFGLVTEIDVPKDPLAGAGTPAYMAPEQAAGRPCGPAADWYSVGVVLYEALTGKLPPRDAAPPPGAPSDLGALCAELLRQDPAARPRGPEIIARLSQREAPRVPRPGAEVSPLLGRSWELEQLRQALVEVRRGRALTLFLSGEAGSGKSAVLAELPRIFETTGAMVLRGRCYHRERLPYRGLDGAIDALVRELSGRAPHEVSSLAPTDAGALAQIFPVIAALPGFAARFAASPGELRARAFAALRELLFRLARRQPVVIALDDWQWADPDSSKLLRYILADPDPPPLLLVAAVRSGPGSIDVGLGVSGPTRTVHLGPLTEVAGRELCAALGIEDDEPAAMIAARAAGSPGSIVELARHHLASPDGAGEVGADQALRARIEGAGELAAALLELLAIAETALTSAVASAALERDREEVEAAARELRAANLAHGGRERAWHALEPASSRVGALARERVSGAALRRLHLRLARALEERGDADAATIARHYRSGGDLERAKRHTELAADHAAAALAFERAAELYAELLDLSPPGAAERRRIEAQLGDALANAGRGLRAADHYLAAARGAGTTEARALRRRAADQLLRTGHTDEGLALARELLAELGERLPKNHLEAALTFARRSAVAWLRGTRFRERSETEIPARDLERIDTLYSLTFGLGMVDTFYGAVCQRRYLELALGAGEPIRVARALATVAPFEATTGVRGQRRATRLWNRAAELAARAPGSDVVSKVTYSAGFSALQAGRWRTARTLCDRAVAQVRQRGADVSGDLAAMQITSLWALYFLGEIAELAARVPPILRDAEIRGDRLGAISARIGPPSLIHLVRGDPEAAHREIDEAMERWGRRSFDIQRLFALFAQCEADLYAGNPAAARSRLRDARSPLRRSLLWLMQLMRAMVHDVRGRVALAAAAAGGGDAALLAEAAREARALERERTPWIAPLAQLLRAGIAAQRGDETRAAELLAAAALGFDDAEMALHGSAARRRLGELVGGERGRARVEEADAWLVGQTIRDPATFASILTPW